jgi:glycosyltransferase involved in cell wall biosynthesis
MALNERIILTVTNDLTYDQRMQKICRTLVAHHYEVELVGRQRAASVPLGKEHYKQTRLSCWFDKGKLFYLEYNIRLFLYLLFTPAEAICAVDLDTIVPAVLAAKLKGSKTIYDAHEYFTEVPEVVRRPTIKKIWLWVERKFVPHIDLAYTVSPAIAGLFTEKFRKDFHVIMNVPMEENREPGTKNKEENTGKQEERAETVLLYQGALNEGRGLEHLIEAMKEINGKLILAGEGDLSEQLRAQVNKAGLQHKVQFAGFVRPDELKQLTRTATIGINLLENKGLSYYYSLSNKFFDYIQAGVPQVCIGFPEYQAINQHYEVAVLINSCATEEIKQAVKRLLTNKDFYTLLQKNCEVCARRYNWQHEEKKLAALYHELLR